MGMILKIAWRNINRHKGKSAVIGIILFLGAFIMTLGSGIIAGMENGLKDNIVNGFMGDIAIVDEKQNEDGILFGDPGASVEIISNYGVIKKVLEKDKDIKNALPVGKGMVMILNEDEGDPGRVFLLGVDFEEYQKMFPENMKITEGEKLKKDEKGLLIPEYTRNNLYDSSEYWCITVKDGLINKNMNSEIKEREKFITKSSLVVMGSSDSTSTLDIRRDVKGIIKYKSLNNFWGRFVITDIESFRECMGYFVAKEKVPELSGQQKQLFATENLDALFDGDSTKENNEKNKMEKVVSETATKIEPYNIENGTYNIVFVRLNKGTDLNNKIVELNKIFKEKNLGVKAVPWNKATGMIGQIASIIKVSLYTFVILVFFVAVIIIVNTLSMAALERTTEIGMMRAVGAQKEFIEKMFFGETAFLSFLFGGLGIVLAMVVLWGLPNCNITTNQEILQLVFGGDKLSPVVNFQGVSSAIMQLCAVTLIAMIYPMRLASRIVPLDAIGKD